MVRLTRKTNNSDLENRILDASFDAFGFAPLFDNDDY